MWLQARHVQRRVHRFVRVRQRFIRRARQVKERLTTRCPSGYYLDWRKLTNSAPLRYPSAWRATVWSGLNTTKAGEW